VTKDTGLLPLGFFSSGTRGIVALSDGHHFGRGDGALVLGLKTAFKNIWGDVWGGHLGGY
jgi:hypothetical protein